LVASSYPLSANNLNILVTGILLYDKKKKQRQMNYHLIGGVDPGRDREVILP